jgi:glucosamine--fructose-6-phosphate aminotransferase (isomerizing)
MLGERMENEIRQQPEVLAKGLESYLPCLREYFAGRAFDMVLLTARGSSDNAALFARYLIEIHLGIPVSLSAPSVLTRYGTRIRYSNCLGIGISQSGAAPDVAEVLAALREDGHATLAITNTPDSRITKEAEHTLLLDAGPEQSVAATKTYTASALALYEVVRALGAELPVPYLPDEAWIERAYAAAEGSRGLVVRSNPVFSLGRGYGFSTAHESALKLMECALIPCKAYSTADFEHGPKALAGYQSAAISYDGPKPELAAQGCTIIPAPEAPAHETIRPIWDVIYGQWMALLAARARGLNPDVPQHIQKVTQTL